MQNVQQLQDKSYLPSKRLTRAFYARDTHEVARDLLGKLLVRQWRKKKIIGRIVEVECYVGENDLACHASRGKTKRNAIMFDREGRAYVYLIYGMYDCLNIVSEKKNFPAAILIRSLEPISGIESMRRARHTHNKINLTTGPGKLTQALRITRSFNSEDIVCSSKLFIVDDGLVFSRTDISTSPRVGIDYAGKDALLPWRYYVKGSAFVSIR